MVIKELHDLYGPVVRIGPNLLDLDTPALIRTIYSTDGNWKKVRNDGSETILATDLLIDSVLSCR